MQEISKDNLPDASARKRSRNKITDRALVVEHGTFINYETNDEFQFPCPFFLGESREGHLDAMKEVNRFVASNFDSYVGGILRNKESFLTSKGYQDSTKTLLRCQCIECKYSIRLYFYESALPNRRAGWYLTDLHPTKHSDCNCSITFKRRGTQQSTPSSAASQQEGSPAMAEEDINVLDNYVQWTPSDWQMVASLAAAHDESGLVNYEALPQWCVLEAYQHLKESRGHASNEEYSTDAVEAWRELHALPPHEMTAVFSSALTATIQRYRNHLAAALRFEAQALNERFFYFANSAQFQKDVVGILKLISHNAKVLQAPSAQAMHRGVLDIFRELRGGSELNYDCAHSYLELALSWERSGSFEQKTLFLICCLRIMLKIYNGSTDSYDLMLDALYYLSCLRFRTWCTDDFVKQFAMLDHCGKCGEIAMTRLQGDRRLRKWKPVQARILQSLAVTCGELHRFEEKKAALIRALELRRELYNHDENHIEVVRTRLHIVINQYEIDQNAARKKADLADVYEKMRMHHQTEQHTEMAWTLRHIAEATEDPVERRAILLRVLATQKALLSDQQSYNVSIARTQDMIAATYVGENGPSASQRPAPAPAPPIQLMPIRSKPYDTTVFVKLESLVGSLSSALATWLSLQPTADVTARLPDWLNEMDGLFQGIEEHCS